HTRSKRDWSSDVCSSDLAAGVSGAPVEGLNASALIEKPMRYEVNVFNQITGYENIFAIGDIALMQTEDFPQGHPMVAQPAIQQRSEERRVGRERSMSGKQ